ncbi:hypothetical protein [Sphingomonas sp. CLY1604]|uniref:hypothetical protein n=1 Tax=Sphingomonas sp. CLY1604 TaxID=3457786 RepID=UPI003FD89B39
MADLIARQQTASLLAKTQVATRYGGNGVAAAAATPIATASKDKVTTPNGDVATISLGARRAAAQLADARKDFGALAKEVRASLDSHSQGSTGLEAMSGRALAAIALDHGDVFSRTEVVAAKAELQARERQGVTSAMRSGGGLAGLATYSQTLVSDYDTMSSEERQARGWSDRTRSAAAALVTQTPGQTQPSLSDRMD